jgi:hypothetical protein
VRARLLAVFFPFLLAGFLAGTVLAQASEQQYDGLQAQQNQTRPETTAETQSADGLRAGDGASSNEGFSCADIVDISQSASRDQYNFSSARLQECLAREVLDGGVKGRLADTGGAPLLPIAAFLLTGVGIFVGRAVIYRRDR